MISRSLSCFLIINEMSGLKYSNFPTKIKLAIQELDVFLVKMNEQEVANTIYSLGLLAPDWDELSPKLIHVMLKMASLRFDASINQVAFFSLSLSPYLSICLPICLSIY